MMPPEIARYLAPKLHQVFEHHGDDPAKATEGLTVEEVAQSCTILGFHKDVATALTSYTKLQHEPKNDVRKRRFHAYNMGLYRTGTISITKFFNGNYHAAHEFKYGQTVRRGLSYELGRLSEEDCLKFLHERDQAGMLEMDSAGNLWRFTKLLVGEFPEAKFVATYRDCYSWVNSQVNWCYRMGWPRMIRWAYADSREFGIPTEYLMSQELFEEERLFILKRYAQFWDKANRAILGGIPAERLLLLKTSELGSVTAALGEFLGIPENSINPIHANAAPNQFDVKDLDDAHRSEVFACCDETMKRLRF